MKKVTLLAFLLALGIGASAQSAITVGPSARGKVGPTARSNSTVNVPPVAKVPPVAVQGGKKK
ncbi:MAG: hypothetical protein WA655_14815 [Candidatus Korobacteraceae bacterium]